MFRDVRSKKYTQQHFVHKVLLGILKRMELKSIRRPAARGGAAGRGTFSDPRKVVSLFGLAEGLHLADFGAGSGHYALAAARAVGHSGKVYVIDIQEGLLARIKNLAAAEHLRNVLPIRGNIEQVGGTKLRDGAVDAVMLCNVLYQVDHKGNVLSEAKRVIHPKGRLFVVDWTDSFGGLGPHPSDVVTEAEASEMLGQAGFMVEKSFSAGAHHFGIIARRP